MSYNTGSIKLRLANHLATPRVVVLEPWAGEYTLRSGKTFEIVVEGDLRLPLEIELVDDRIIVYSFDSAGANMAVFEDGKELEKSE